MREPQDWDIIPNKYGSACYILVDYGSGPNWTLGRAYPADNNIVYADEGGWCTQYVKSWMPVNRLNSLIAQGNPSSLFPQEEIDWMNDPPRGKEII